MNKKVCEFCSGPAFDVVPAAERLLSGLGKAQREKIALRLHPESQRLQKLEAVMRAAENIVKFYCLGGDCAEELKSALRDAGSKSEFISARAATPTK